MSAASPKKLTLLASNLRKQDTWAEKLLWNWLRDRRFTAYKFRRQHTFGDYILDFFCIEAFLNIELDGSQHGFPEQKKRDEARDAWLEKAEVRVLRFWNARLRCDKEWIRETIWRELQQRAPRPLSNYCRPMTEAAVNGIRESSRRMNITFPSPPPSPLVRGRTVRRLSRKRATGFARCASANRRVHDFCALSPRESVRVRGNELSNFIALPKHKVHGTIFSHA
jgi:very-short-patch-repair endonuclease